VTLGASRSATAPFIATEVDPEAGALFAYNAWNAEFGQRVAFADLGGRQTAWTGGRAEVLGRNGTPDHPALLEWRSRFSGRVGAGLDPCAALQTTVDIPAGGHEDLVFFLGQAASVAEARELVSRYREGTSTPYSRSCVRTGTTSSGLFGSRRPTVPWT
jgi:cyclic beta-1,2-glucan synthetase